MYAGNTLAPAILNCCPDVDPPSEVPNTEPLPGSSSATPSFDPGKSPNALPIGDANLLIESLKNDVVTQLDVPSDHVGCADLCNNSLSEPHVILFLLYQEYLPTATSGITVGLNPLSSDTGGFLLPVSVIPCGGDTTILSVGSLLMTGAPVSCNSSHP